MDPSSHPSADPSRSGGRGPSPSPAVRARRRPRDFIFFFRPGYLVALAALLSLLLLLASILLIGGRHTFFTFRRGEASAPTEGSATGADGPRPFADGAAGPVRLPWDEGAQVIPKGALDARYAALADLSRGVVIASRKADERIFPASMTKVMTLIVIVENLPNEDALRHEITISREVCDAMRRAGASGVGLEEGEALSVESLLYALILKSDGVAACELARYVAGSEEDFVELMNLKAARMGLSGTHFANPTGLYDPSHYSTCRDTASLMAYAMDMSLCRRILLTQSFQAPFRTSDGQALRYSLYHHLTVTLFEKCQKSRTPTQPDRVTVLTGKTGFTDESRYCLVTYAEAPDGRRFVCVTAGGGSYESCIQDYIRIYNTYVPG